MAALSLWKRVLRIPCPFWCTGCVLAEAIRCAMTLFIYNSPEGINKGMRLNQGSIVTHDLTRAGPGRLGMTQAPESPCFRRPSFSGFLGDKLSLDICRIGRRGGTGRSVGWGPAHSGVLRCAGWGIFIPPLPRGGGGRIQCGRLLGLVQGFGCVVASD